jgi:hypothetical protein
MVSKAPEDAPFLALAGAALLTQWNSLGFCLWNMLFLSISLPLFSATAYAFERFLDPPPCHASYANSCGSKPNGLRDVRLFLVQSSPDSLKEGVLGKWRLVRTPGPDRSGDVVSGRSP